MPYQKLQASLTADVTPSDTVDIPNAAGADMKNDGCVLYIGTGGNIKVLTAAGTTSTFTNVPDGAWFPIQVVRVFATDTTASGIIALW